MPQVHGGALTVGGRMGGRDTEEARVRRRHIARLADQELLKRLSERPHELETPDLIAISTKLHPPEGEGAAGVTVNILGLGAVQVAPTKARDD